MQIVPEAEDTITKGARSSQSTHDQRNSVLNWVRRQTVAEAIPELTPAAKAIQAAADLITKDKWLFDPNSASMQAWNIVMLVLLAYTASLTPFEVCFMGGGASARGLGFDQYFCGHRLLDRYGNQLREFATHSSHRVCSNCSVCLPRISATWIP
jgi:hypothetical protein